MALTPGTRLGPYEISERIGAGGMGEVYGAIDTNLSRPVAIKVLPDALAADADRLARFEREAKTLAALNHPNIALIYGLERSGGATALVMERVDGLTLADRLASGAIPLDEALPIARQIADALEAAHEQGIVHRDLKPANVKLRPDGRVKVLDFGLAKAVEPSVVASGSSQSPTITTPAMTQAGVILGTAAYMSPEQARGKAVDKRSDVWAFGCVLFEMLTGRRAFHNEEVSDTLALVLTKDPNWDQLPAGTPGSIQRLLRRCLVKDRQARLPDIGSARLDIDDARAEPASVKEGLSTGSPRARAGRWAIVVAVSLLVAAVIADVMSGLRRPTPSSPVTRTLVSVAPAERFLTGFPVDLRTGQGRPSRTAMAFTADGLSLVFTAERDGRVQVYVRRLDRLEADPIAGTEDASSPFVSPDGKTLGFYADGALKKVPLSGGPPVTIANADLVFGASWAPDDQIVFGTQTGGLWRVPAAGGVPTRVTKLQPNEYSHRLPHVLPDGKTVVFTSTQEPFPAWDATRIVAQSLDTGTRKVLVEGGADARYVPTGHLVFVRRGTLMAVPFDAARLEVTGSPVGLLADVMQAADTQPVQLDSGAGQFAVSQSGSLAYISGGVYPQNRWSLTWFDRTGKAEPLNLPPGAYHSPRLSPDGKRVAFNTTTGDWDLMVYDVARRLMTRLPMPDLQSVPVWSPDSSRIAFTSGLSEAGQLLIRSADGNGAPEVLPFADGSRQNPVGISPFVNTWTPDGAAVIAWRGGRLFLLPRDGKSTSRPLLADTTNALHAEFSPDGRWLAYTEGSQSRSEVYVRPYPALDRRELVAGEISRAPVWRGRELFYLESGRSGGAETIRVVSVPVSTTPTFSLGSPHVLFEGNFRIDGPFRSYDVTQDGQRFVMVQAVEQPPTRAREMVLVQNWFQELRSPVAPR